MSTFEFTDDRPITKSEQDLLGRTAFASSLARAISNWKNTESLVIALTGPWGCGKSSIKNLVIETLDNDKKTRHHGIQPMGVECSGKAHNSIF